MGSRPSSSEPARATMALTSGHLREDRLLDPLVDGDGLGQVDGRQLFQLDDQVALVQGRHEGLADPGVEAPAPTNRARATAHDRPRVAQAPVQGRDIDPGDQRTSQGSPWPRPCPSRKEARTGITVSDRSSEESSAKTMVRATGTNSLPSSPCRVSSGRKTMTMMQDAGGHRHRHLAGRPIDQVQARQAPAAALACSRVAAG